MLANLWRGLLRETCKPQSPQSSSLRVAVQSSVQPLLRHRLRLLLLAQRALRMQRPAVAEVRRPTLLSSRQPALKHSQLLLPPPNISAPCRGQHWGHPGCHSPCA